MFHKNINNWTKLEKKLLRYAEGGTKYYVTFVGRTLATARRK